MRVRGPGFPLLLLLGFLAAVGPERGATAQGFRLSLVSSAANQQPGDVLDVSLTVTNPGVPAAADFYLGVLLPDGHTIVSFLDATLHFSFGDSSDLTSLRPIATAVNLSSPFSVTVPGLVKYVWNGSEPSGQYLFFLLAIAPGALSDGALQPGELLGLTTASVIHNVALTRHVIFVDASNEGGTEDGLTEATAWGTINEALQDSRFRDSAGNTILIAEGVYREQVDVFARMSGGPGAFNTIRAAEGAEVVVDGEKDTPRARVEGILIHGGVSHVRIESLVIRNAQHRCILVFESGPVEIVGNRIQDCGDSGIEFWYGAHDYDVADNVIFGNEADGIVLSQGSGDPARFAANQRISIRNNVIFGNGPGGGGDGIQIRGDQPHTFVIHNNTIAHNVGNGIALSQGVGGGDVRNNIVADNGRIGLKNFSGLATSTDFNNLFGNGALGNNNFDSGATGVEPGPNTISADPRFVDPATGDFRLRAGSPSIDAGDPDPRFTDADGTRNDMGAYGGPAGG